MTQSAMTQMRIGVLVVAYNAAQTLASVLDRLPPTFRRRVDQVLVSDDASEDAHVSRSASSTRRSATSR